MATEAENSACYLKLTGPADVITFLLVCISATQNRAKKFIKCPGKPWKWCSSCTTAATGAKSGTTSSPVSLPSYLHFFCVSFDHHPLTKTATSPQKKNSSLFRAKFDSQPAKDVPKFQTAVLPLDSMPEYEGDLDDAKKFFLAATIGTACKKRFRGHSLTTRGKKCGATAPENENIYETSKAVSSLIADRCHGILQGLMTFLKNSDHLVCVSWLLLLLQLPTLNSKLKKWRLIW